jgi:hypothetical protein
VIHALSCFSCVVFSTPLFVSCHFSCSVCVVCDSSISIFGLPLWSIQNLTYSLYIFNMLPKYKRSSTMIRSACILIYGRFITNIFTQYYNHINFNWRKEFYVIYRHNISLAAAVEIYVLVNTINFIIAFKYKIRLNFSWNMETGNYLQTYCNLYVYYDRGIVSLDLRYSIESSYNYIYPYHKHISKLLMLWV